MRYLALALLAIPSVLAAQRDTTVCTAFRTRTSANGSILSTSVTKVTCGGATRVDTVKVSVPGPIIHDTVAPPPAPQPVDPRGYNCWMARDASNPTCIDSVQVKNVSNIMVLHRYGQTFGYAQWIWKGVITAYDPSLPLTVVDTIRLPAPPTVHDTITLGGRVDTLTWAPKITAAADSIRWSLEKLLVAPAPIPFPRDKYFYWQPRADPDSIRWTMTLLNAGTPPAAVPYPTKPSPSSNAPELPRGMAAMDSMIASARRADSGSASWPHIKQDSTGKWVCYLNCTPAALARVRTMNATKPKVAPKPKAMPPIKKEPVG